MVALLCQEKIGCKTAKLSTAIRARGVGESIKFSLNIQFRLPKQNFQLASRVV